MKRLAALLLAVLFTLAPALSHAQTFPALSGRVVDAANLLTPAQKQALETQSAEIQKASQRQFVIATIPDLQGYPIEDYGYKLGRAWGIGQKGANNGIILIVAPNERKVRIEVGYGLEPIMTDALSQGIIDDQILPRFRNKDMGGGIVDGANAIAEQMKLPPEEAEKRASVATTNQPARVSSGGNGGGIAIFWIIVVLVIVLPMIIGRARGTKYRNGRAPVVIWGPGLGGGSSWGDSGSSWGSSDGGDWGGGGGGGFSGGGGSFGGGGASGGW
jgi:uncharacterized protein